VLEIVNHYAKTWKLLLQYDEDAFIVPKAVQDEQAVLDLPMVRVSIAALKTELMAKAEATELFGQERGHGLDGIIAAIQQTFGGQDLYPGVAQKAAHLLYFAVKDHPFSDGNKRIGAFLFLLFLKMNGRLNQQSFSNNALVALTLLTAASDPGQKDILIRLIMNLITAGEAAP
jgi:prophage maintenance system killer protein